ncbi:flagellar hook-basal body complex protein [Acidiphilium acidophilum]|jgi:flagellar basal-body rod protein FlgF|uniref:flagellar hook-basal body protein n=1 Tax=Acidiphilium acidophilum TaxID=76588 RepID=UPI002E8E71F7|nr:flagellar hook-basal body complex protein [Acidiphilium acidophilum]
MAFNAIYTSMASLETSTQKLDTIAQNLANTNTEGYASVQTNAVALSYRGDSAIPGADVVSVGENADTQAGSFKHTGSPFDVAVKGGWLVAQTPGGRTGLTRNGSLAISSTGLLTTASGDLVLGSNGTPISLPQLKSLTVSSNGEISGIAAASTTNSPQVFGRLMLASTPASGSLVPMGNTLYGLPAGQTKPTVAANAQVEQGYLEDSNVNSVKSMIDLISTQRGYSLDTQVVTTSSQTASALNQVLMA